ncbi:Phosphoserine phosphatase [Geodia barretti]|uniref:Phosphoserine phosphatase n=1 Tax=Geodia barretti TaxID=519541 RepID=A0AA35TFA8_GEOBA|nr:Phosphoserine phosphatase [Geodia barretti]
MHHALGCALDELRRLVPSAPDSLSIETLIAIRNQIAEEQKDRGLTHEAIRLEAFKQTLQFIKSPDDDLAAHLNTLYLKHRFEDIQFFDDVLPALNALQRHYMMGILSNGNTYPERCGLAGYFQFVVLAQDYGIRKPDPRLFEITIERAGCAKHQLLHVGDSFQNDIIGAKQAGVRSVWLNREGGNNETEQQPDFEISSLRELTEVLENFM